MVAGGDYSWNYSPGTPPFCAPDVVWRNATSGNLVVWHLDSASARVHGQFTNPAAPADPLAWVVVGPK